jgi:hypothetical protein
MLAFSSVWDEKEGIENGIYLFSVMALSSVWDGKEGIENGIYLTSNGRETGKVLLLSEKKRNKTGASKRKQFGKGPLISEANNK